jgi:hypothetical protein
VAATFVMALFSFGLGFYGLTVYVASLQRLYGWSASTVSLPVTVYYIAGALLTVLISDVYGRYGPRVVVAAGAINLIVPGTHVVKFSVQTRELKEAAAVPTSEGMIVNLDVSLLFRLRPEAAARVYKTIGTRFEGVVHAFYDAPRCGEVYNIGGGRGNSCSVLEAFERITTISGREMQWEYLDKNREGDHICYVSDLSKMRRHFPGWNVSKTLDDIFREIYQAMTCDPGRDFIAPCA